MRICLLTNQPLDSPNFPKDDWPADPRPYVPEHDWTVEMLTKPGSVEQIEARVQEGVDLFFNLCDGAADQLNSPGLEVVQTLERLGVPFTGARSDCYEPSRLKMKEAARRAGVRSPACVVASDREGLARAARELTFPLFVKHYSSYASVGITPESKVDDVDALIAQGMRLIDRFGAALVEEYVDGIECTVLVAENPRDRDAPIVYTPMQYTFPEGAAFKHEALKWVSYHDMGCAPVADPALAARLKADTAAFFLAIGASSFGRCDIRVGADGVPSMLEINPNCGVFYPETDPGSADLILLQAPGGHREFVLRLIAAALSRQPPLPFSRPDRATASKAKNPARVRTQSTISSGVSFL